MEIDASANIQVQHTHTPSANAEIEIPIDITDRAVTNAQGELSRTLPDAIRDVLLAFGYKPSPQILMLTELMLHNGFPITRENLEIADKAFKLVGDNPPKILFFLENQIWPTPQTAEALENLAGQKTELSNAVTALFDSYFTENAFSDTKAIFNLFEAVFKNISKQQVFPQISYTDTPLNNTEVESVSKNTIPVFGFDHSAPIDDVLLAGDRTPLSDAFIQAPEGIPKAPDMFSAVNDEFIAKNAEIIDLAKNIIENAKDISARSEIINTLIKTHPEMEKEIINLSLELDKKESMPLKGSDIEHIFTALTKLFNGSERERIFDLLKIASPKSTAQIKEALALKFALLPEEFSKAEYNSLIRELSDSVARLYEQPSARTPELTELRDNLLFLNQIKDSYYVQIPLVFADKRTTGELYVFKKKMKKNKDSVSALIALDTANLGRFESYIVKQGKTIDFQFRLDNPFAEKMIRENFNLLGYALESLGYTISSVSYTDLRDKFNILATEPGADPTPLKPESYVFDARM